MESLYFFLLLLVLEVIHPCDFRNINQCGYMDISPAVNKWMRAYEDNSKCEIQIFSLWKETRGREDSKCQFRNMFENKHILSYLIIYGLRM